MSPQRSGVAESIAEDRGRYPRASLVPGDAEYARESAQADDTPEQPSTQRQTKMTTTHGRFSRAVANGNLPEAVLAARDLGGLKLDDALSLCVMLAERDPPRFESAALRCLQRLIDERPPPIAEVALAATPSAELRHGEGGAGRHSLKGSRPPTNSLTRHDGFTAETAPSVDCRETVAGGLPIASLAC